MDMGSTDHPEDEEVQPDVSLSSLLTTATPKHRHSKSMPVSPIQLIVSPSLTRPALLCAPTQDSWLNYKSTLIFGKIWAYGPSHATPSISYDLPSSASVIAASKETQSGSGSVGKGLGIKVLQMCGTADILHRQAMRLDEVLRSFGKEVVRPELIVVSSHLHRSLDILVGSSCLFSRFASLQSCRMECNPGDATRNRVYTTSTL
jgi:hypothetical protein